MKGNQSDKPFLKDFHPLEQKNSPLFSSAKESIRYCAETIVRHDYSPVLQLLLVVYFREFLS